MKRRTIISLLMFLTLCVLNGQDIKPEKLQGSWAGNIILPEL